MRSDGGAKKRKPVFQVIILGSGGGSTEDNVTGLLVRSTGAKWAKGSVLAVDAGVHLSGIIKILGAHMPTTSTQKATKSTTISTGPFAGLTVPHISAHANAAYILREMIHTFLITHPHLDHLSGFIINTPAFQPAARAKRCAALPQTIEAIRTHIFNDLIWPNLSDEDGGVGLVTYMRLTEGGNDFLGSGDERGYIEVAEGLATKCLAVTHGSCRKRLGSFSSRGHHRQQSMSMGFPTPDGHVTRRHSQVSDPTVPYDSSYSQDGYVLSAHPNSAYPRRASLSHRPQTPGGGVPGHTPQHVPSYSSDKDPYDSSAFFIRDLVTCTEILVFGDVEPDSIALHPRNHYVWRDAAAKVASGTLLAIFIECSYDNKISDQFLFGHLCPRHLVAELEVLAGEVVRVKNKEKWNNPSGGKSVELMDPPSPQSHRVKRARIETPGESLSNGNSPIMNHVGISKARAPSSLSGRRTPTRTTPLLRPSNSSLSSTVNHLAASQMQHKPTSPDPSNDAYTHDSIVDENLVLPGPAAETPPLENLTVYIIHVKDIYEDGPDPGEVILEELEAAGKEKGLGCKFVVTRQGESYFIG